MDNTVTIPADTPRSDVCVVGTVDEERISPVTISNAMAFVNVPPTSIPILILLSLIDFCSRLSHRSEGFLSLWS